MTTAPGEPAAASPETFLSAVRAAMAQRRPYQFIALGNSMKPFIRDGEQLTLLPVELNQLRLGDVISYIAKGGQSGAFVTHRVVWKSAACLWIKGDSLSPVSRLRPGVDIEVLGRVESITHPTGGHARRLRPWRNCIAVLWSMLLVPWQKLRGH